MALKKSELYSLWASCDELREGMDASQYRDCPQALATSKPSKLYDRLLWIPSSQWGT